MKHIFGLLLFLGAGPLSVAQDAIKTEKKIHYFFAFNSGLLASEQGKSITYSTSAVPGITLGKRLRVGAGIGFDSYNQWQTIPLFGQVTFDFPGKKNVVFLQCSYGWAKAWMQKPEYALATSETGGRMFSSMIGFKIVSGKINISAAAGYKFQSASTGYSYNTNGPLPYRYGYDYKIEQTFERLVFTLGVGWK